MTHTFKVAWCYLWLFLERNTVAPLGLRYQSSFSQQASLCWPMDYDYLSRRFEILFLLLKQFGAWLFHQALNLESLLWTIFAYFQGKQLHLEYITLAPGSLGRKCSCWFCLLLELRVVACSIHCFGSRKCLYPNCYCQVKVRWYHLVFLILIQVLEGVYWSCFWLSLTSSEFQSSCFDCFPETLGQSLI